MIYLLAFQLDCIQVLTRWNYFRLYLRAIFTAAQGVIAIFISGLADYSNYKKQILIATILVFGVAALPFAALTDKTYGALTGMAVLYGVQNAVQPLYQIMEGAYIPIFMRARSAPPGAVAEEVRRKQVLEKGSYISAIGLVIGNVGGITALLIGVIIAYGRHVTPADGYYNYLLAITIAGCITVVAGIVCAFVFPATKGKPFPADANPLTISVKRVIALLSNIRNYPEAYKLCIGWVIWDVSYSNFLQVFGLLFREQLGLGSSDAEYTVYSFMTPVVASIGSLAWVWAYPRCRFNIKTWAYAFILVSWFAQFWGCLGISNHTKVGYRHRWEFWVFEVFYVSTSSALRSLNRALYSSMLPEGEEAQFFGLEIILGVAVGWIGPLVNGTIQNKTGNLRYPMLPNLFLVIIALGFYVWVDSDKGMKDAEKLIVEQPIAQQEVTTYNTMASAESQTNKK